VIRYCRTLFPLLLSALLAGGCGASALPVPAATPAAPKTAVVSIGDIVSVLTVDGVVVARPTFVLEAPATGTIRILSASTSPGSTTTRIATIESGSGEIPLILPANSGVTGWMVRDGDPVTAGLPVVAGYYSGFAIQATVADVSLYRLYGAVTNSRAEIPHGPGPFQCDLLGGISSSVSGGEIVGGPAPSAADGTPATTAPLVDATGPVRLLCSPPRDIRLFAGMHAIVAVTTAEARGAMLLPVEAVAGSSQHGKVTLMLSDGSRRDQSVEIGITDGVMIQITGGLKAGDEVAVPGPFLQGPTQ
jgi:hypothetical protein